MGWRNSPIPDYIRKADRRYDSGNTDSSCTVELWVGSVRIQRRDSVKSSEKRLSWSCDSVVRVSCASSCKRLSVIGCKRTINPITNPNPVYSHLTRDNILSRVCVATIIRLVLDWQLDLLDHTQLQCIHFTTHYYSCNSSLKTSAGPEYSLVTGTVHVTNS
jgi:hypothetical protein